MLYVLSFSKYFKSIAVYYNSDLQFEASRKVEEVRLTSIRCQTIPIILKHACCQRNGSMLNQDCPRLFWSIWEMSLP